MELTKKTTILFPPHLHQRLLRLAKRRRTSLGELVRAACEAQYGTTAVAERLQAVEELRRLTLPVAETEQMEAESRPSPGELLP